MEIVVRPKRVLVVLLAVVLLLVTLNVVVLTLKFRYGLGSESGRTLIRLFDLNAENNVPTYFAALLLFVAAVLLFVIGCGKRADGRRYGGWWALSCLFAFLSTDEMTQIHEQLNERSRSLLHLSGQAHYAWLAPYSLVLLVLSPGLVRFTLALPRRVLILAVGSAGLYLLGAAGIELIGGLFADTNGEDNPTYATFYTLEEALEKVGMSLFVFTLVSHLRDDFGAVSVSLEATPRRQEPTTGPAWAPGEAGWVADGPGPVPDERVRLAPASGYSPTRFRPPAL